MRDVLIEELCSIARRDPDVYFIAADLGAAALDSFREELPRQFIHSGISEQNMIDVAAGLATCGKKVYCYAMSSFITARCYEQIKVALGAMNQPVTLISVGVGMGYDDAGPTHYTTEDIAIMRALPGIEVLSPADAESTLAIARHTHAKPAFRYLRLERPALPPVYQGDFAAALPAGFARVAPGSKVAIVSSGYMLHRSLEARALLAAQGVEPAVFDLFRVKPLDPAALVAALAPYDAVVTVEEQWLAGGFGSVVLEAFSDVGSTKRVVRIGLPDRWFFENGGRKPVLDAFGLGVADIARAVGELHSSPGREGA
ncbi:MAG: 1-deoxy-D-xylulose-5-phosphate synthase [Alphaproteobacteria bacterium]|nr:1-deoxy-D-xylulose-5-phosphate synthase [Alphaproteobacteria bacterium]MBF0332057.1 1-deoxy-D-xylulose-5-phosphate synthase [Alphaproteobacteria bacterium]